MISVESGGHARNLASAGRLPTLLDRTTLPPPELNHRTNKNWSSVS